MLEISFHISSAVLLCRRLALIVLASVMLLLAFIGFGKFSSFLAAMLKVCQNLVSFLCAIIVKIFAVASIFGLQCLVYL